MPEMPGAKEVDDYIAGSTPIARPIEMTLRQLLKDTWPDANETVVNEVPTYQLQDKSVAYGVDNDKERVVVTLSETLPDKVISEADRMGYETDAQHLYVGYNQPVPLNMMRNLLTEL
ncbi:hypothetical protein [Levilactobacillus bambusae]|uniref:Uncharacterized protein n=1 Tax=Levilactobacillus bambusae TaxID=2024736 RepID=A0A2V1N241_9LACO|nr:hypothetical protein [Levilactobacillus bambusae]PWG00290.1 hypothetical protein DCM90_04995 [Levilactobacillus bambusae]